MNKATLLCSHSPFLPQPSPAGSSDSDSVRRRVIPLDVLKSEEAFCWSSLCKYEHCSLLYCSLIPRPLTDFISQLLSIYWGELQQIAEVLQQSQLNSGKPQLIYHVWIWLSFPPQQALPLCSSTILVSTDQLVCCKTFAICCNWAYYVTSMNTCITCFFFVCVFFCGGGEVAGKGRDVVHWLFMHEQ